MIDHSDTLPKEARSILLDAFSSSYKIEKNEEKALKIAWDAVNDAGYIKKGDSWVQVSKVSLDYWMHRFKGTERHLGQLLSPDERKKILRAARAHAGGKAKAAKMKVKQEEVMKAAYIAASAAVADMELDDGELENVQKDLTAGDVHVDAIMASKKKKNVIKISKMDEEKKIVYGVALEPYTVDSQGDWETPEDIEKTAHKFMKMYREMGIEHIKKNDLIYPVESYIAPADMVWELPDGSEEIVKKGSWILGSKVEDDQVWEDVKSGLLTGYSVDGDGQREEAEPPNDQEE